MADESVIVAFLKDCDVACPKCQYNLRDAQSATCPECGYGFVLTMAPFRRKRYGAFIAALTSVSLSAGCGLPLWIYPPLLDNHIPAWLSEVFVDYTWTSFWLMFALLIFQRVFMKRSIVTQWFVAATFILFAVATVAIQWATNFL